MRVLPPVAKDDGRDLWAGASRGNRGDPCDELGTRQETACQ